MSKKHANLPTFFVVHTHTHTHTYHNRVPTEIAPCPRGDMSTYPSAYPSRFLAVSWSMSAQSRSSDALVTRKRACYHFHRWTTYPRQATTHSCYCGTMMKASSAQTRAGACWRWQRLKRATFAWFQCSVTVPSSPAVFATGWWCVAAKSRSSRTRTCQRTRAAAASWLRLPGHRHGTRCFQ